jgi:hypothetical protein
MQLLPGESADTLCDGDLIIADELTERTLRFEAVGTRSPRMQVGDSATFYNEIYDAEDNVIGSTVGLVLAVSVRPGDGHMMCEYREGIELRGDTFHSFALMDRDALMTGSAVQLDIVGISGRYTGKRGIRECRLLPPFPATIESRVSLKMVLRDDASTR